MGVVQSRLRQAHGEAVEAAPTPRTLLAANEVERRPRLQPHEVASLQLATPHIYAILSAAVYDRVRAAPLLFHTGWSSLMTCASCQLDREGYFAEAFVHPGSRHCIVAQRGTTDVFGLRAGVWMLFAEYTIQVALAEQFSREVRRRLRTMSGPRRRTHEYNNNNNKGSSSSFAMQTSDARSGCTASSEDDAEGDADEDAWFVSYTGHSLGALLAAHRATEEHTFAITFESPGCFTFLEKNVAQGGCSEAETNVISYLSEPNPINTLRPQCGYQLVVPIPEEPLQSDALLLSAEPSRRGTITTTVSSSSISAKTAAANSTTSGGGGSSGASGVAATRTSSPSNNNNNNNNGAAAGTSNSKGNAIPPGTALADGASPSAPAASRWKPSFSVPSISVPSIRVPSLSVPIRSYVSRCARDQMLDTVGIPELQQYFIKLEPMIREMFEQAQQEHNVRNFIAYFAQREATRRQRASAGHVQPPHDAQRGLHRRSGPQAASDAPSALTSGHPGPAAGEAHVLRWPNNVFQFIEYYNTKRALDDPENRPAAVHAAYQALLRRIKHTEPAAEHDIDLCYIAPKAQAVVRWWAQAEAGTRRALPLMLLDHKVLNTLTIVSTERTGHNDAVGESVCRRLRSDVLTVVEAKQYLARLTARPALAPYLRQLMHEKRTSHL